MILLLTPFHFVPTWDWPVLLAALIAMIAHKGFAGHVKEDLVVTGRAIEDSFRRTIFSEIKEGLAFIAKYRDMRFVVYVFFLLMAGLGAISCVIIVFIQHAFGTSTRDLGFLGMFLVGGLFFGAVVYVRSKSHLRPGDFAQVLITDAYEYDLGGVAQ